MQSLSSARYHFINKVAQKLILKKLKNNNNISNQNKFSSNNRLLNLNQMSFHLIYNICLSVYINIHRYTCKEKYEEVK